MPNDICQNFTSIYDLKEAQCELGKHFKNKIDQFFGGLNSE